MPSFALNEWIDPVTDRTQTDVDEAKAYIQRLLAEYKNSGSWTNVEDLKGALNKNDIIRILNNIILVYEEMGMVELHHLYPSNSLYPSDDLYPGVVTVVDASEAPSWLFEYPELPTVTFYNNLITVVAYLRGTGMLKNGTPSVPSHPLNTYDKWNAIEQIIKDVYEQAGIQVTHYAGDDVYAGENIGLLL